MHTYAAFLRAINVGGSKPLKMPQLADLVARAGGRHVRTWIASGNVVFGFPSTDAGSVEGRLDRALCRERAVASDVIVRSVDQLESVESRNPFPEEARRDPAHLTVTFFKRPVPRAALPSLQALGRGRERVAPIDRDLFVYYPEGIGRSKLTLSAMERLTGDRGTSRNWNTVVKITALAVELRKSLNE